ncbi:quinol monooxygenase YgiN [Catenibacillus scindens]|uniref:Quinol monooxygenase YgiN n=1 Tax=Catenibacillus scindens TaxID=673271 RepID=A0A7W8HBU1_9FIRM|nr:putative quinol monooxygenase [Catenibacillus scindens]MBB5265544.1 quinol monooxygenase YgiN [Catenibacillus scindens]
MIIHEINCHIKPGEMDAYLEVAKQFVAAMRGEEGCISSQLCRSNSDENKAVYFVQWRDMDCAKAHSQGENFKKYIPLMGAHFIGCDEDMYEVIDC